MRTYAEYLATLTVKQLREIAARTEIHGRSTMAKPRLVEAIDNAMLYEANYAKKLDARRTQNHIDRAHNLAIAENAQRDQAKRQQANARECGVELKVFPFGACNRPAGHPTDALNHDRAQRNRPNSQQAKPVEDTFTLTLDNGKEVTWTGAYADLMRRHTKRVAAYRAQNGTTRLTSRQRRRTERKARNMYAAIS